MSDLIWLYGFNIICNSFLAFFTLALLLGLLIFLFRIKQPRFKAFLLALPICKLVLDPFLYNFSTWTVANGVNPLTEPEGTRNLGATFYYSNEILPVKASIRLFLNSGLDFSVGDVIFYWFGSIFLLKIITTIFFTIALVRLSGHFYQLWLSKQFLKEIIKRAEIYGQTSKVNILLTNKLQTPCAYKNYIFFPKKLIDHLTQAEFQAIVAHESAHIYWHDGLQNVFHTVLKAFFWWIPLNWWLKKLNREREYACDRMVKLQKVPEEALVTALQKVLMNKQDHLSLVTPFVSECETLKRIKTFLQYRRSKWMQIIVNVFVGIFALVIFFGKYWIF